MSQEVDRYLDRAKSFLDSLEILNIGTANRTDINHLYPLSPKLFLLGHAFELLLKACLKQADIKFAKTHNLVELLGICLVNEIGNVSNNKNLSLLARALKNHYSLEVRYPTVDVRKQSVSDLIMYDHLSEMGKESFTPDPQEGYLIVQDFYQRIIQREVTQRSAA